MSPLGKFYSAMKTLEISVFEDIFRPLRDHRKPKRRSSQRNDIQH